MRTYKDQELKLRLEAKLQAAECKTATDVKRFIDGIPRRSRMDYWTPAMKAIFAAIQEVEKAGAHPLLTDAVILLGRAQDKVADFVEEVEDESIFKRRNLPRL